LSLKSYILQHIDIEEFYKTHLEDYDGTGNVACPFSDDHDKGTDDKPSFGVREKDGAVHCFSCDYKASSPIGYYEDFYEMSFKESQREIFDEFIEKIIPEDVYINAHTKLLKDKLTLKRLKKERGINIQTVKKFKLGWYKNRLSIPIINEFGFCVDIRRYDLLKEYNTKMLPFMKGYGKSRLFPINTLRYNTIIITAGELDTLLCNQMGFPAITVTGTELFWNNDFNEAFKDKEVVIIPDNDKAGKSGANKKLSVLSKYCKKSVIVELPVKKNKEDFTDWVLKYGGTEKQFKKMVKDGLAGVSENTYTPNTNGSSLQLPEDVLAEFSDTKSRDVKLGIQAEYLLTKLRSNGHFYRTTKGEYYYSSKKMGVVQVFPNYSLFAAYLSRENHTINTSNTSGKHYMKHIENYVRIEGQEVITGNWSLYRDRKIYIRHSKNKILKIENKKRTLLDNAYNSDSVLLEVPKDSMFFKYDPTASYKEAIDLLWNIILHNIPISFENKLLVLAWNLGIFIKELFTDRPILRYQAKTASGKSTANRLMNLLFYNQEMMASAISTSPALYQMASTHPMLTIDNVERVDLTKSLSQFLTSSATGAEKHKRAMNTDTGVVTEAIHALITINGIEKLGKTERINRLLEVNLDLDKYGQEGFNPIEIYKQIADNRDYILSGLTKFFAVKIIPLFEEDSSFKIAKNLGKHSKQRFNPYIGFMGTILKAVWPTVKDDAMNPGYTHWKEVLDEWVRTQDEVAKESNESTNAILDVLDYIEMYKAQLGSRYFCTVIKHDGFCKISGTSKQILATYRLIAKDQGIKVTWEDEGHFKSRVMDSLDIIEKAGWAFTTKKSGGKNLKVFTKGKSHAKTKSKKKNKI